MSAIARTRERVAVRSGAHGAAVLIVLVVLSTCFRAWAALEVPVPWIAPDEMVYGLLGLSLYDSGHLAILDGPTPYYTLLEPAFTGIPLTIGSFAFGYDLLKVLQALAMSLTAVPVYLWGCSLVSRRWALVAAALTLAVPGLALSGLLMTEVLFYPLLVLVAWAMAHALVRPTPRAQSLVVAASIAAAATRLQAIILLPAFVGALMLYAALSRSTRIVRPLWPTFAALTAIALAWLGWRLSTGGSVVAGYAGVTETSYGIGDAARFVVYHSADLLILTGVFPVCAVAVLLIEGLRRGELSEQARAYLAVAASLVFFFVVEVGVFASQHVGRLAERNLLALAPVLFLGLVLWLSRGGSRGFAVTAVVALVAAAALMALPVQRMVVDAAAPDAFTLIPFIELRHASSLQTTELVFYIGAGFAVLLFVLVRSRWLLLLPVLLIVAFVAASVSVSRYVSSQARVQQASFLGPDRRWVDRAAVGPTAYLYDGERDWNGVWQTIFWNRRVDRVYDLLNAEVTGPLPQQQLTIEPDGRLTGGNGTPAYAVAPGTFGVAGTPVANSGQAGFFQGGLQLWKVAPPLRLVSRALGLKPNGEIDPGGDGQVIGYDCRDGGTFLVTLLVKEPQTIVLARNGLSWRTLSFRTPQTWHGRLPAGPPRPEGICTLDIHPTGLLGTTVLTFEPG